MTGIPAATSGSYHNYQYWRESPVLAGAVTIPQYFRSLGYRATGGGKIFHALSWLDVYGYDGYNDPPSWDAYFPTEHRAMPEELRPQFWRESKTEEGRPPWYFSWGSVEPEEHMADSLVVDWAVEELQKEQDQPFFQAVGIYRPHIPWLVPRKYFDMYPLESVGLPRVLENDLDDVPEGPKRWIRRRWHQWLLDNDEWRNAVQGYSASVTYADAQIGRILDALDQSPHAENTMIVLWSDHGMHLGEKEQWEKFTLWEESTRVPFIMSVPGLTPEGAVCHRPVSLLDIYPTLVELSGGTSEPPLEGVSLKPWLQDPDLPSDRAVVTTWHQGNHAVRSERWRYIRYQTGLEELYDHQSDPDEFHNLAGEADLESVKEDLARWLPEYNAPYQPLPSSEMQILLRLAEGDASIWGD
jgi:arylsulfatase A-like enzyme